MSELSKSSNPRVRRSYAHVMLGKLANDEVSVEAAEAAIQGLDQTNKGRASNFGQRLLKAREKGAEKRYSQAREAYHEGLRNRPTIDCDVEIITSVPLPNGDSLPIVVGAGSFEDFDRAYEEGREIASGPLGKEGSTNHVLRRMAETGGLSEGLSFLRGVQLGQLVERSKSLPTE